MADSVFSGVENPLAEGYGGLNMAGGGLAGFISNLLTFISLIAGLLALLNLVLGGLAHITSEGKPENLEKARRQIYMSLVGLIIIAGSYAIIAVIGQLFFTDSSFFLNPTIQGPGEIIN